MPTRRDILMTGGITAAAVAALSSYAFAIEPQFRLVVTPYRVALANWPAETPPIRIAAIADLHACDPWMPLGRIRQIVEATNQLEPDLIVLLGDYVASVRGFGTREISPADWGSVLGRLRSPLGTRAVLGNHDWESDPESVRAGLADNGIGVMENAAELIARPGEAGFWLAGLGDQLAVVAEGGDRIGVHNLPATLAQITDNRPVVLIAHEPDIFAEVPARVGLTLAGHTHGGQVNLPLLGRPLVPSAYGERYAYGHIVEAGRHLVVSGGLGCTNVPVRFRVPPEIVIVEVGPEMTAA